MTADQPAEVRDRLAAYLRERSTMNGISPEHIHGIVTNDGQYDLLASDIRAVITAGDAAVAALARGIAVCDGLIEKACDPKDHSDENMLARVCLPIVGLIRDALAVIDGVGDGGERHG